MCARPKLTLARLRSRRRGFQRRRRCRSWEHMQHHPPTVPLPHRSPPVSAATTTITTTTVVAVLAAPTVHNATPPTTSTAVGVVVVRHPRLSPSWVRRQWHVPCQKEKKRKKVEEFDGAYFT